MSDQIHLDVIAVGTFYNNLIDAGMEKDDAMFLTQEYMSTLKSMTNQFKS